MYLLDCIGVSSDSLQNLMDDILCIIQHKCKLIKYIIPPIASMLAYTNVYNIH